MYERHKRKYSLRAKGERAVDVVLIKVGHLIRTFRKKLLGTMVPPTAAGVPGV